MTSTVVSRTTVVPARTYKPLRILLIVKTSLRQQDFSHKKLRAESSARLARDVRPWIKTDDYWETCWALTKAIKFRFDSEGISIPFPQHDIHVIERKPD